MEDRPRLSAASRAGVLAGTTKAGSDFLRLPKRAFQGGSKSDRSSGRRSAPENRGHGRRQSSTRGFINALPPLHLPERLACLTHVGPGTRAPVLGRYTLPASRVHASWTSRLGRIGEPAAPIARPVPSMSARWWRPRLVLVANDTDQRELRLERRASVPRETARSGSGAGRAGQPYAGCPQAHPPFHDWFHVKRAALWTTPVDNFPIARRRADVRAVRMSVGAGDILRGRRNRQLRRDSGRWLG